MNVEASNSCFYKEKEKFKTKLDLSRKGSVDEPIRKLIEFLNSHSDYYSTSSCSGRIILLSKPNVKAKKDIKWLTVSHEKINDADKLINLIEKSLDNCILKFESAILHICSNNLKSAQKLLSIGIRSGFKNSEISISKKDRIIVAIRGTLGLEIPLSSNGRLLVTREYIEYILQLANEKFDYNSQRIERLFLNIKNELQEQIEAKAISLISD